MINARARIAPSEALRRFKLPSNAKQAVTDSELKTWQDKQIKPLLLLATHALEQSAVEVSSVIDEDIREFAGNAQSLLKLQSQYILFLHSEVFFAGRQLLSRL